MRDSVRETGAGINVCWLREAEDGRQDAKAANGLLDVGEAIRVEADWTERRDRGEIGGLGGRRSVSAVERVVESGLLKGYLVERGVAGGVSREEEMGNLAT